MCPSMAPRASLASASAQTAGPLPSGGGTPPLGSCPCFCLLGVGAQLRRQGATVTPRPWSPPGLAAACWAEVQLRRQGAAVTVGPWSLLGLAGALPSPGTPSPVCGGVCVSWWKGERVLFLPSPPRSQTPQDTNRASETDTHSLGEKNSSQVRCTGSAFVICRYRALGDPARKPTCASSDLPSAVGGGASPALHRVDRRRWGCLVQGVCPGPRLPHTPSRGMRAGGGEPWGPVGVWRPAQGPVCPTRPPRGCGQVAGSRGGPWGSGGLPGASPLGRHCCCTFLDGTSCFQKPCLGLR